MNGASFAQRLALSGTLKRFDVDAAEPVRVGFLAPLSGPLRPWGRPGLNGCEIWADGINGAGGLLIGGVRHRVELVAEDSGSDAEGALAAAGRLVEHHQVRLVMMLGGDAFQKVRHYLTARKILTSTLLPSDLSPDTPYVIAPSEIHPLYTVTGVNWLARSNPGLRRVAICSQADALGRPSRATYRAAFKAEGIAIDADISYPPDATNAAEIVAEMLSSAPDILCWCTSYPPMVHALTEAAFHAGFAGQIISCTADDHQRLVARTSVEFMEGFVFQFPDFDDPLLRDMGFFFNRPAAFFAEYNARFPGEWSAVAWEYAATLDLWQSAVETAGTVSPVSVLAAMKQGGQGDHAFGRADWSGLDLFGNDNALIGQWPVVRITSGRPSIVEFGSIPAWLSRHGDLLRAEMEALGQMWYQRQGRIPREAGASVLL